MDPASSIQEFKPCALLDRITKSLRNWEEKFRQKHGRTPTNQDIRADQKVYGKYLERKKLKKEMAEKENLPLNAVGIVSRHENENSFKAPTPIKRKDIPTVNFVSPNKFQSKLKNTDAKQSLFLQNTNVFDRPTSPSRIQKSASPSLFSPLAPSQLSNPNIKDDTKDNFELGTPKSRTLKGGIAVSSECKNKMTLWMLEDESIDPTPQKRSSNSGGLFSVLQGANTLSGGSLTKRFQEVADMNLAATKKSSSFLSKRLQEAALDKSNVPPKKFKRNKIPQFFTNEQNAEKILNFSKAYKLNECPKNPVAGTQSAIEATKLIEGELFGTEFNKPKESNSFKTLGVTIDEEPEPELPAALICNKIVSSQIIQKGGNENNSSQRLPALNNPPIKFRRQLTKRNNSMDNVVNKFMPSRSLRRASSLCNIGQVPTNYKDFLTEEEVKLFANVIEDVVNESELPQIDQDSVKLDPKNDHLTTITDVNSSMPKIIAEGSEQEKVSLPSNQKIIDDVRPELSSQQINEEQAKPLKIVTLPTKSRNSTRRRNIIEVDTEESSYVNSDENNDQDECISGQFSKSKSKTKECRKSIDSSSKTSKLEASSGWNSKTVNKKSKKSYGNFRALKLKGKTRQGQSGSRPFGASKFQTVK